MGVFVCDKCECVENTALGLYWSKDYTDLFPEPYVKGTALCSECAPTHYYDGEKTDFGVWHGQFPKLKWDGKRKVMNREANPIEPGQSNRTP